MSIKPLEYFIENINSLNKGEYRSLHKYYLTKENKRLCNTCLTIFSGISEHFHIQRYHGEKPTYTSICKSCQSQRSLERNLEYRKSPEIFIKTKVSSFKARAKEQNVPFNLTSYYLIQQFYLQEAKCYYTNETLSFEHVMVARNMPHPLLASLDRKNPELGYIQGNVVWCTYFVNRMKNECSYDEFIKLCTLISSLHC